MLALIDEAVAESSNGFVYVVAAVVVIEDVTAVRDKLIAVVDRPGRSRPVHWSEEGLEVRAALCEVAAQHVAMGAVTAQACGRKGQERARSHLLLESMALVVAEGANSVIIESRREALDIRDRRTFKSASGDINLTGIHVSWKDKSEPLLWLADALASATREEVLRPGESASSGVLIRAMGVDRIRWIDIA